MNWDASVCLPAAFAGKDEEPSSHASQASVNAEELRMASNVQARENSGKTSRNAEIIVAVCSEFLLEQIRNGDHGALALLFQRYARLVRTVAYRILRDSAEADDLVQEVFLFIFRKAALFDRAQGTASTWIIHVAYHRAFDRRRYLNTRRFYSSEQLDDASLGTTGKRGAFPFHDQTLEGILGKQVLAELEEQLTPEQREAIRLYFFEGYSFKEIAELTGRSLGNVRNHYYRGLDRIRKSIFPDRLRST